MNVEIAVAVINGAFLLLGAYIAKQNRDIRIAAAENAHAISRVEFQTDGQLDAKIRTAVMEVFREHKSEVTEAVMAESVRHLLDAMINGKDMGEAWPLRN